MALIMVAIVVIILTALPSVPIVGLIAAILMRRGAAIVTLSIMPMLVVVYLRIIDVVNTSLMLAGVAVLIGRLCG